MDFSSGPDLTVLKAFPGFDRSLLNLTAVTPSMLELLRHSAALRGDLLTEPATIKSVMLKFVDSLVELQGIQEGSRTAIGAARCKPTRLLIARLRGG